MHIRIKILLGVIKNEISFLHNDVGFLVEKITWSLCLIFFELIF